MSIQTLAYLLPVLTKAIQNAEKEFLRLQQQGRAHEAGTLQALVVVPSRELAMQIVRVAQGLLPHEARATIQQCIGGANPNRQVSCKLHLAYSCAPRFCKPVDGFQISCSAWLHCMPCLGHQSDSLVTCTEFNQHVYFCVSWRHSRHCS